MQSRSSPVTKLLKMLSQSFQKMPDTYHPTPSLFQLFNHFSVLKDFVDVDRAEEERRGHADLTVLFFNVSHKQAFIQMPVEIYWKTVFSSRNVYGDSSFPHLMQCISLLLFLPFSNMPAERVFSEMKLTKSPCQNQIGRRNHFVPTQSQVMARK